MNATFARRLGAALIFAGAAFHASSAMALAPADTTEVAKAEAYFDQVSTLKARFIQVAQDGDTVQGTFYLARPGRLRLEYGPPSSILVVAEDGTLVYYDAKLAQVTYVDLDSTMAGVLVREHVKLDGEDLKVTSVAHRPGVVEITVIKRSDPRNGQITLVFTEMPFQLRQWRVVDQQGQATMVTLYDAQIGIPLDDALFQFHDPRPTPGPAKPRKT
jgi:outer membrane lipoprotein-sorting protein